MAEAKATTILSWGKPTLKIDGVALAYTPVEDSTELQTTKGDKREAKIEGGENEAIKYKKSTYAVVFNIRKAGGRTLPFEVHDGVVAGTHKFELIPEDVGAPGFSIEEVVISVDDTFTTADGAIWAIQCDAIKPATGDTINWTDRAE